MSESFAKSNSEFNRVESSQSDYPFGLSVAAHYLVALVLVALATAVASAVQNLISAANLTLIYVLPVIISASASGWGPSLLAIVAGVVAFDFFFTAPYYSLVITDPTEIWAAMLLLVIGTIVASVSAQSRRRALEATEAAERAEALHSVAHAAIHARSQQEVVDVAAAALNRMFAAPALIFMERGSRLDVSATAGGATSTEADHDAARGALSTHLQTRGENYPYEQTYFDFWPISTSTGLNYVLGVDFAHAARERPEATDGLIESVAGYIGACRKLRR